MTPPVLCQINGPSRCPSDQSVEITGNPALGFRTTLSVAATSSDADATAGGVLSLAGYGPLTDQPFTDVPAPPPTVT